MNLLARLFPPRNPGRDLALIGARQRRVEREQLRRARTDEMRQAQGKPQWKWRAL